MKTVGERLMWFRTFVPLYERAAPLVRHIADVERLEVGELPVSPHTLAESNSTLRPILEALRKMPEPEERELASIQRQLETALSNCVKAAESAARYIKVGGHSMEGQILLGSIINSTVLAHEYMASVSRKLSVSELGVSSLEEEEIPSEDVIPPAARLQLVIDRAANCIESGLDKLGDAVIFAIAKTVDVCSVMFKTAGRLGRAYHRRRVPEAQPRQGRPDPAQSKKAQTAQGGTPGGAGRDGGLASSRTGAEVTALRPQKRAERHSGGRRQWAQKACGGAARWWHRQAR